MAATGRRPRATRGRRLDPGLIRKIQALPPTSRSLVESFVDFVRSRAGDRALVDAAAALSADSFRAVWDNPDDAAYDKM